MEFASAPPISQQVLLQELNHRITNAARHAFCGKNGKIRVELTWPGEFVECKVLDNGSARKDVAHDAGSQ